MDIGITVSDKSVKENRNMREELLFCDDWMFHRGDIKPQAPKHKMISYQSAKTERYQMGPASPYHYVTDGAKFPTEEKEYTSEDWEKVRLPHDYMAGDGYDPAYSAALGFCKYDNGWYVKRFTVSKNDEGKRLTLLFEGVTGHATVTLNGCLMKHNFCGYTPFEVDITDMVKYGTENSLAVYVNVEEHEGWWYEGAGIYRPVWFRKTDLLSIDLWGVYARPERQKDGTWIVHTETTLRNDSDRDEHLTVKGEILDADGQILAVSGAEETIALRDRETMHYDFAVKAPNLWSPESPYRYTMRTRVFCDSRETDFCEVRFGFRSVRVDCNEGLFINDRPYRIKGFCGHESCGLTGKAIPASLQRYRVRLMKEMGANAYRTAHYPQSEALMEALDEAGFLVMDETRWFESTDEGREQMETLVRRDRNRPCVIFWSIGNEEPLHTDPRGVRICRSLRAAVRKLDPSRPILTAVTHKGGSVYDELDIIGTNYLWKYIDAIRAAHPDKPFLSSECGATGTTRGWYFDDDPLHGYVSGYDHDINSAFMSRESTWKRILSYPWMMGGFFWNAFEYRGEAVWPRVCSVSGAVDLYLQPKDAFYQHKALWLEAPMAHILPHWNFAGREGDPIRVSVYTNQPQAELFLNGESFGKRSIETAGHAEWQVPYSAGRLEVRCGKDGNILATDVRETTGTAVALKLRLETPNLKPGDMALVTCFCVDSEGREVPDASPMVDFTACGDGRVYSTGSGNADHTPIFSPNRKMWMGRISVAVKRTGNKICRLYAMADGLQSAQLVIC